MEFLLIYLKNKAFALGVHVGSNESLLPKSYLHLLVIIPLLSFVMLSGSALAQSQNSAEAVESEIRALEAEQIAYLMDGRVAEMKKNWDQDFTVNNPFNVVQDAATGPIQTGTLTYARFERNIEKILIRDSLVVVMGNELVVPKSAPQGSSHDTDQPITRRFTNIWINKGGKWLMFARHANNVCKE